MNNSPTDVIAYTPPVLHTSRSGLIKLHDMAYDKHSPIVQYLISLKSEGSQRTMYRCLRQFAIWYFQDLRALPEQVQWSKITYNDIVEFQLYLNHKPDVRDPNNSKLCKALAPSTRNAYIIAIRGVMKKASRLSTIAPEHKVSQSTYLEIGEIKLDHVKSLPKSRPLSDAEVDVFLASFTLHGKNDRRKKKNIRDKGMFFMLIGCGLRVGELVNTQYPDNIKLGQRAIQIVGKGAKERRIPMNPQVETSLKTYIEEVRGQAPGPLWHPINRHGQLNLNKQITEGGVRDMLHNRGAPTGEPITPHYLRKHFGTALLDAGVDVLQAKDTLGHESVNTTHIYDGRGDKNRRDAVNAIQIGRSRQQ